MAIRTHLSRLSLRLRNPLKAGELNYASFWFSQLLMIAATILGVYLASSEGMKVAIKFNELTRLERSYYLRQSLANELEWNARMVLDYSEQIADGISSHSYFENNTLSLDQFVWKAMGETDITLETPSQFLSAAQQFYREVPATYEKLRNRTYGAQFGAQLLQTSAQTILDDTVPDLRKNTDTLKQRLTNAGMEVY